MNWFRRAFLNLLLPRVPKPATKYVGLVHAYSTVKDEPNFRYDGYWILTETGRSREAKKVGDPGNSAVAIGQKASVEAWLAGGPLPRLGRIDSDPQPPKPRKSRPVKKDSGNVVSFKARKSA